MDQTNQQAKLDKKVQLRFLSPFSTEKISVISQIILVVAALIMIGVYYVPFWKIEMWAPQYPEWLQMKIWVNKLSGDIDIINGLNHYIGMKYIKVVMFPEFKIMPYILGSLIAIGVISALIGRKFMVWAFFIALAIVGIAGITDYYLWGYDYGHNLDPTAAIIVPGMVYQPPLIGTKELLNFIAYSAPDIGAWIMIGSAVLILLVIFLEFRKSKKMHT